MYLKSLLFLQSRWCDERFGRAPPVGSSVSQSEGGSPNPGVFIYAVPGGGCVMRLASSWDSASAEYLALRSRLGGVGGVDSFISPYDAISADEYAREFMTCSHERSARSTGSIPAASAPATSLVECLLRISSSDAYSPV